MSENKNLLIELDEKLSLADGLLREGRDQQQQADELLADVDFAHQKAVDAVNLGDTTLKEAQKTYATLQGTIIFFRRING